MLVRMAQFEKDFSKRYRVKIITTSQMINNWKKRKMEDGP